jgi:copper chaperone
VLEGDNAVTMMTISVPEIHCNHCKHSIERALAPLPGVRSAQVDIDARTVTVDVDTARVDRDQLVGVIEEQGYEVPA